MPPTDPDRAAPTVRPAPPPDLRWYVRAGLVLTAVALVGVFGVAAWLNPYAADGSPRTMATHRQLGIPECHFVTLTGKPCPSCGMTTSFALLVRGDVGASLRANWVGTLLALLWAALVPWAVVSAIRGRPLFLPRNRLEVAVTSTVGVVLVLMLGRWAAVLIGGQR